MAAVCKCLFIQRVRTVAEGLVGQGMILWWLRGRRNHFDCERVWEPGPEIRMVVGPNALNCERIDSEPRLGVGGGLCARAPIGREGLCGRRAVHAWRIGRGWAMGAPRRGSGTVCLELFGKVQCTCALIRYAYHEARAAKRSYTSIEH